MGSDENHFNVSLTVRDKVTRQCGPETTTFEGKGEPKRIRTEVPLLTSLAFTAKSNRLILQVQWSCLDVPVMIVFSTDLGTATGQ